MSGNRKVGRAYFQVVEPDTVDEEDDVEQEVSEEGADDERFAAVGVSQRSGKQSEDDPWSALKRTTAEVIAEMISSQYLTCSIPL